MLKVKTLIALAAAVGVLGSAGAAYAATVKTPAEITAAVTGKTVEEVIEEREAGAAYGAIASEAGKLDEFKAQMLERKKAVLDQRVADGTLTQQQADDIYNAIKNNQATCSVTGAGRGIGGGTGRGSGMRYGAFGGCLR